MFLRGIRPETFIKAHLSLWKIALSVRLYMLLCGLRESVHGPHRAFRVFVVLRVRLRFW